MRCMKMAEELYSGPGKCMHMNEVSLSILSQMKNHFFASLVPPIPNNQKESYDMGHAASNLN